MGSSSMAPRRFKKTANPTVSRLTPRLRARSGSAINRASDREALSLRRPMIPCSPAILRDYFWNDFAADKTHSIPDADRAAYVAAYSRPGRMRAGWADFVSFQQAAKDLAKLSQTKLTMPVLAIGGDKANGTVLGNQMKLVATNATMIVLKDTGHWVLEERPKETTEALMKFL